MLKAREQELRDKRHGSKREIRVTLDFAGTKINFSSKKSWINSYFMFEKNITGRQLIEEANNFDELFSEQHFEEHGGSESYYDQYTVNPLVDFPRPMVKSFTQFQYDSPILA